MQKNLSLKMAGTSILLMMLICLSFLSIPSKAKAASPQSCGQWSVVTSPNGAGSGYNILTGVAAVSSNDIWAVGSYDIGNHTYLLIEQWNGMQWNVVSAPNPGIQNFLSGVAPIPRTHQLWAVGNYTDSNLTSQTLIERWNGTQWSVVSSPSPGGQNGSTLKSVAAVSATDAWSVGYYVTGGNATSTLIEHWNGTQWSVVSSPNPGPSSNTFNGVVAISASNIWAVGYYLNTNGIDQALVEHWNGSSWSVVASPNPGSNASLLQGVAQIPGTQQLWAVGYQVNSNGIDQALVEHWNGSSWSVVASPNPGSSADTLNGVAAISTNSAWAVGSFTNGDGTDQTLIEHWNGLSWVVVASPNPGRQNFLYEVTRVPGTSHLWTGGNDFASNGFPQTLTEYYC